MTEIDEIDKKCKFALFEFLENMNNSKKKKGLLYKLFSYTFTLSEVETAIFKYAYWKGVNDGMESTFEEIEEKVLNHVSRNNR